MACLTINKGKRKKSSKKDNYHKLVQFCERNGAKEWGPFFKIRKDIPLIFRDQKHKMIDENVS